MAIDELMNVAQILQQFPSVLKRRRHEFDQGLGKIRRDVFVGEGRTQILRMPRLCDLPGRRDAQGFLFYPLAAAAQYGPLA